MANRGLCLAALLALVLALTSAPGWTQCSDYELRVPDGLKAGHSLAIRSFTVKQPVRYDQEPLEQFQALFAKDLQAEIQKLGRFEDTRIISEVDAATTELVLEGIFTRIDQGNRAARVIVIGGPVSSAAVLAVSGLIKRTSDGEEVLRFSCSSETEGGLIGMGGAFSRGGKTLLHSRAEAVAQQIAKTIVKSDKKPSSAKVQKVKKKKT